MPEQQKNGWKVDKTVSITTVMSLAAAVVSIVLWVSDIRTEVHVLTRAHAEAIKTQQNTDYRQDETIKESHRQWREDLQLLHDKLDRLIERR